MGWHFTDVVQFKDVCSDDRMKHWKKCLHMQQRPPRRDPRKQTLLITACKPQAWQLPPPSATDCTHNNHCKSVRVVFLLVNCCTYAVSVQFMMNCDFPELEHRPASDMVICQDPDVWTSSWYSTSCPGHYIKECIIVIRISAAEIMVGAVIVISHLAQQVIISYKTLSYQAG